MSDWLRRFAGPLRSRKVQAALVTVLTAYFADWGFEVSTAVLAAIVAAGVAVILGIAHEDAGLKASGRTLEEWRDGIDESACAPPVFMYHRPNDNGGGDG